MLDTILQKKLDKEKKINEKNEKGENINTSTSVSTMQTEISVNETSFVSKPRPDVNLPDDTDSSDEVDSNEAKWPDANNHTNEVPIQTKVGPKPDSRFKNIMIAEVIVFCALLCIGLLIGIIAASGGNLIDF